MILLGELLSYLDRGEADEVVMQSGQPAKLRTREGDRQLGKQALSRDAILAALHGSSVGAVIPKEDTAGEVEVVEIRGRAYMMNIAKFLDLIEVRIARLPGDDRDPAPPREVVAQRSIAATRREVERQTAREVQRQTAREVQRPTARELQRPTARDMQPPIPVQLDPVPTSADVLDPLIQPRPPTPTPPPVRSPWQSPPRRPTGELHPVDSAAPGAAPSLRLEPGAPWPDAFVDLVAGARDDGASDVHLLSGEPVRVRVASRLVARDRIAEPALIESTVAALLDEGLARRFDLHAYVDFSAQHPRAGRLRLNLCRQRTGLKLCARLVADGPPAGEAIGLPPQLDRFSLLHQGLCVVAGPSGHGKTTTMAALVDRINANKPVHIITVEDPVEIIHPIKRAIVTQREVGTHTRSFESALKAALREDPDVIAIGELRDRETVEMALSAAETGHLVVATMNTPSGAKTIERLIELFPPEDQAQVRATMSGTLKLIVSQRLLPREDGKGLVAAYEVITGGPPLWGLIRDRKLHQLPSLLQRGKAYGMRRLEESLRELVLAKAISHEQALRHADDPRALAGNDATVGATWNSSGSGR